MGRIQSPHSGNRVLDVYDKNMPESSRELLAKGGKKMISLDHTTIEALFSRQMSNLPIKRR